MRAWTQFWQRVRLRLPERKDVSCFPFLNPSAHAGTGRSQPWGRAMGVWGERCVCVWGGKRCEEQVES